MNQSLKENTAVADGVGALIRGWRNHRRLSQMELALDVGISPRHLSFLETGRSQPSRRVLLALAERLGTSLRVRNSWLLTAGYSPDYSELPLDSSQLSPVRLALQRLLEAHHPYPGLVVDRSWNIVMTNPMAQRLVALLPTPLNEPPINLFRISLHPDGLAALTANFEEWGRYLLGELEQLKASRHDEGIADIYREVFAYPNVARLADTARSSSWESTLLVPFVLRLGGQELSFFTTLARIGSPREITLDELCIEMFYPTDDVTRTWLNAQGNK